MEGSRLRRWYRRGNNQINTILPIRSSSPPNYAPSCCYCDFKIFVFNDPLFRFGRRHASFLRFWFSVGVDFSITALLATPILVWYLLRSSDPIGAFSIFPSLAGLRTMSLADSGLFIISTLLSVSVHEFGHAVAAASDGIRLDYIAVFVAFLFPGALVALDCDLLQALPHFSALFIYSAGVWHNAAFCAVCGWLLFLLPSILFPFYIHVERPLVLDVASTSPLYGVLSPGDVIVSMDGVHVHDEQEWRDIVTILGEKMPESLSKPDYARKGYCIPNSLLEESKKILFNGNHSACPYEHEAFETIDCIISSKPEDMEDQVQFQIKSGSKTCLNPIEVVKLDKCGHGWMEATKNGNKCTCSGENSCLGPVQLMDSLWVEITYSRRHSSECQQLQTSSYIEFNNSNTEDQNCGGTFVFIGEVISLLHEVQLTAWNISSETARKESHMHILRITNARSSEQHARFSSRRRINFGSGFTRLHIAEREEKEKSSSNMSGWRNLHVSACITEDVLQFLFSEKGSNVVQLKPLAYRLGLAKRVEQFSSYCPS